MDFWRALVVTASDERQAEIYERQIESAINRGIISRDKPVFCVPDKDGKRVGSGGATLNAILAAREAKGPGPVVVLHSGGDSRRIPLCTITGKAFSRLPDGKNSYYTPFDKMLESLRLLFNQNTESRPLDGCVIATTHVLIDLTTPVVNIT